MDRIYKVVITGFVIQKDYMDEPDTWDWTTVRWDDFIRYCHRLGVSNIDTMGGTDITCTELVEATKVERVIDE